MARGDGPLAWLTRAQASKRASSSQMAKPLFQLALARRYGHLIHRASVSALASAENLASFVGGLGYCPNLHSLVVKDLQVSMDRLLAFAGKLATDEALASLADACRQLTSLALGNARSADTNRLLASTTRLQRLSLAFTGIADLHGLWTMLKSVPGLTALDLALPAPATAHPACLATLANTAPQTLPPITELKVELRGGATGLAKFLSLFEATLQDLSLKAGNFAGFAVGGGSDLFTSQSALPRLSRLELAGESAGLGRILQRLEPERLPSLRRLCIFPNHASRTVDLFPFIELAVLQHVDLSRVEYYTLMSRPKTHHSSVLFDELGIEYVSSPCGLNLAYLKAHDKVQALSAEPEGSELRAGMLANIDKSLDHIVRARNLAALHNDTASYA